MSRHAPPSDPPPSTDPGTLTPGPAWLRAATQLGVPAVLAMALVFWLMQRVDGKMDDLTAAAALTAVSAETAHQAMSRAEINMRAFADDQRVFNQRSLALLRQICLNDATTPVQVAGCR